MTPETRHGQFFETEIQQRERLLLGIRLLTIPPFALSWMVGAIYFARHISTWLWAFGGALVVFLGLVSLYATLSWGLKGNVHSDHWVNFAVWSHLGLVNGCRLSTASVARQLIPPCSREDESPPPELMPITWDAAKDEESKLQDESNSESQ